MKKSIIYVYHFSANLAKCKINITSHKMLNGWTSWAQNHQLLALLNVQQHTHIHLGSKRCVCLLTITCIISGLTEEAGTVSSSSCGFLLYPFRFLLNKKMIVSKEIQLWSKWHITNTCACVVWTFRSFECTLHILNVCKAHKFEVNSYCCANLCSQISLYAKSKHD